MTGHRHQAIDGSRRGFGAGVPVPHCRKSENGKPCGVSGAHTEVRCKCGAIGVQCPECRGTQWRDPDPAAVSLGKRGGSAKVPKGFSKMDQERRAQIAKDAAKQRWAKKGEGK